jgi:hypothetical protein
MTYGEKAAQQAPKQKQKKRLKMWAQLIHFAAAVNLRFLSQVSFFTSLPFCAGSWQQGDQMQL